MNGSKYTISLVVGIAFSAALVYLSFRNVPLSDIIDYAGNITYIWILPSVCVIIASFVLRVFRWRLILSESRKRGQKKTTFVDAYHPLMTGFMLNCILPGRLGEIVRPSVLYLKSGVPFSTGIATLAVERLFDLLCLILLFAVILKTVPIDPSMKAGFGRYSLDKETLVFLSNVTIKIMIILFFGLLALCFDKTRRFMEKNAIKLFSFILSGNSELKLRVKSVVCSSIRNMFYNLESGLRIMKSPASLFACIFLSALIWVASAFGYYLVSLGFPGIDLDFPKITAVMVIICFFIALPSVPGYWGVWEAGSIFALSIFGVKNADAAIGFTIINHVIQILPIVFIGIISVFILGVDLMKTALGGVKKIDPET